MYTEGLEFDGNSIERGPLGGSESAFIYLAKSFAKAGHNVIVYCKCPASGVYDGVQYNTISQLPDFIKAGECDIFIASRFYQIFKNPINAKLRILWNHDIMPNAAELMSVIYNIDYMYCLSNYHKRQFIESCADIEPIIKLVPNAVDHSAIVKTEEKKHQIMFTSRPERGLLQALDMYERLNDKELALIICNYPTIQDDRVKQIEGICARKMESLIEKGFDVRIGQLAKKDLYAEIASSKAVIYPTDFPEIFCISALEAQACGTPFLTYDQFALSETVSYKVADAGDSEELFRSLKLCLSSEQYRGKLIAEGLEHSEKYSWEAVAGIFINDAETYFKNRSSDTIGIFDRLIYESDLLAAREFCDRNRKVKLGVKQLASKVDHMLRFVDGKADYKEIYEDEETHEKPEDFNPNGRFKWAAKKMGEIEATRILDYGCHLGTSSIHFSNENPSAQVVGFDLSEKAIENAKLKRNVVAKNKDGITFWSSLGDIEGTFDAIFIGEVLEHVKDPSSFIQELEDKYLRDGGKMFITVPKGAWEWISREENKKKDVWYHVSGFDLRDIEDIFGKKQDFLCGVMDNGLGVCGEFLGNYLIEYTKTDVKTGKIDLERKFLLARPYQSISACIIAKNSQKDIEHCIESIRDHVDEIIVLDDNSTDDTATRARNLGAIVIEGHETISAPDYWGFANARNATLDRASGKWIFWIDTDERALGMQHIRRFLDGGLVQAFVVKQHHAQLDSFIEADSPQRLFRREKGRFVGYIHEQVMSNDDINEPLSPSIIMTNAKIAHFGAIHEAVRRDKALNRNMPLLEKDAKMNPKRKLTKILIMRDFNNRIKWSYEHYGSFKNPDSEKSMAIIRSMWDKYFKDEQDKVYKNLAFNELQQAMLLTESGYEVKYAVAMNKKNTSDNEIPEFKKIRVFDDEVGSIFDGLKELAQSLVTTA